MSFTQGVPSPGQFGAAPSWAASDGPVPDAASGTSDVTSGSGAAPSPGPAVPSASSFVPAAPVVSLPKGGGAIRGVDEKFAANPVTGSGTLSVRLAVSPGRGSVGPTLALSYDSGQGNGVFGLGWHLGLPAITRKTEKGLPSYRDAGVGSFDDRDEQEGDGHPLGEAEDTFILAGAEDLVPVLEEKDGHWRPVRHRRTVNGRAYTVQHYRPRIEAAFARIERWTDCRSGEPHWRSISRDNVTTVYGRTAESRIADPHDPLRVFSWLVCESFDDTGNAVVYEYKPEDGAGLDIARSHERNRTEADRAANRHLKRIRYGNRVPLLVEPDLSRAQWLFEVVFDYGEHDPDSPAPQEVRPWTCRLDPFSSYRAGFEVRTYRLCRRVLMFHHFPDEPGVGRDCLVRSTDLLYRGDPARGEAVVSVAESVTQRGYRRRPDGSYLVRSMPPLEFGYTEAVLDMRQHTLDPQSAANLPAGLDGSVYRWVDLDGEGLSGILTEQGGSWFYKPNRGDGRFGPLQPVAARPSQAALRGGRQELLDLNGNGRLDLVDLAGAAPGFTGRTESRAWQQFRPFRFRPDIAWDDPNLRFVDLDGDGRADVLITGEQAFTWHSSLGEDGFGPGRREFVPLDEERGPRLVFADRTQAIHLADVSGDGLADLVRIRNGEICYWPNLGYGRFGAKVAMDDAPWLDDPDQFDPQRLRVADIDGSGTADLIYLHRDGVLIHFNRSGNAWGPARRLGVAFPRADSAAQVSVSDLLGNGTACLVWSSPLPGAAAQPLRYLDLMGGTKPHLLTSACNNLGARTCVRYAPSTRFYSADQEAGRPWVTRLPFPVQVVERVETVDRIGRNRFTTRYAYHHGYFDAVEREFRGFGLVEQWDSEAITVLGTDLSRDAANWDEAAYVPPVLTRTWFHTGAVPMEGQVSRHLADEYHPDERAIGDSALPTAVRRPGGPELPWRLSADEARQAYRALKGLTLRQEIYALDGSEAERRPYSIAEHSYTVELLQPAVQQHPDPEGRRPAVYFTHPRETVTAHYERALYPVGEELLPDPRIGHEVVLEVDDFGDVLRSAEVGYGRRHRDPDPLLTPADHANQGRLHVVVTENRYTNAVEQADVHRTPRPAEARTFEVLGLAPSHRLFGFVELRSLLDAPADELPYEAWDTDPTGLERPARRMIEHRRTLFRRDDLAGPLPHGVLEPLALPYEDYRQAFTPGLLVELYGERVGTVQLAAAGYVEHDGGWWIPSGRVFYSPGADDAPVDELAFARDHFFLPYRFRDPFGATAEVAYDGYTLLVTGTRDPLGNLVTAGERGPDDQVLTNGNDYRVLQPRLATDANRNRVEVCFDALGRVAGTAVMGKREEQLGDSLSGFDPDPDPDAVARYMADPLADPYALLGKATTRTVYDADAFWRTRQDPDPRPCVSAGLARETHLHDLADGERTRIQHGFTYSDGFAREVQRKGRAEPGPLVEGGPDTDPRWVGTGWTVFNNKGRPIRTFEPFFTATHQFEFDRRAGVGSVRFYDPVGRVVATLRPDDTYEKVVVDPWRQAMWDVNDTVLSDPGEDPDIGGYVRHYLAHLSAEHGGWATWYAQRADGALGRAQQLAAERAAVHARTPARDWHDSLSRAFLTVAHNRIPPRRAQEPAVDEFHATRSLLDVEGNIREVQDPLGRTVMRYGYDTLGNRLTRVGMDTGESRFLTDVVGKPVLTWNGRGFRIRTEYDALHRPVKSYVQGGGLPTEVLRQRTRYGEDEPDAVLRNLRSRVHRQYDGSGVASHTGYDFKGNLLDAERQLAAEYREVVDWSGEVTLEADCFVSRTRYDALSRTISLTTPDGSTVRPRYNEAGLLEALDGELRDAPGATALVTDVDYNARGQRMLVEYGNGARTTYAYDPLTFRLTRLRSLRGGRTLQDLTHTYDPVGNISGLQDDAQQTVFFRNRVVDPGADYIYDALYRLLEATGREHLGQSGGPSRPPGATDGPPAHQPDDGGAVGRYVQRYAYDGAGNLLSMTHRSTAPGRDGWTRSYRYVEPSLLEPERFGNRLTGTTTGDDNALHRFGYDAHGNITSLPELPVMRWDPEDQLAGTTRQRIGSDGIPETTYYVYDATGQRVRKVTERACAAGGRPTRRSERIYLGAFEVLREYGPDGQTALERETLHILDDKQRVALVETRTGGSDEGPEKLIRYQFADHLGSSVLELDGTARVITYEEYYPYGTTAYRAVRSRTQVPKRYRFTGKERDPENGLYYHGARYYSPWLGRWTSCDPIGAADGANLYVYVRGNPVNRSDPTGLISWGTVAVIAAVVVVSVAVTVATAGAAGPVVAGAAATVFGSGTVAATVATGVVVGATAGAAGGAAGEITRQVASGEATERGSVDWRGVGRASVSGAAAGAVTGGLGSLSSGGAAAAGISGAAARNTGTYARSVVRAATQGAAGGATGETTRQLVAGESFDAGRVLTAAGQGAVAGGGVRAASPAVRPLISPLSRVPGVRAAVTAPARLGLSLARTAYGPQGNTARDAAEAYYRSLNDPVVQRAAAGTRFENQVRPHLEQVEGQTDIRAQVSIRPNIDANGTPAPYRVRVDFLGLEGGDLRISDAKASATAPFTARQTTGYPLIEQFGGTVVGTKGGAAFPAGTPIPPTRIDVYRPGPGTSILKGGI